MTDSIDKNPAQEPRLGNRILHALELALEQEDVQVSDMLTRALELAMTRNAGGSTFVERRNFPPEVEDAMNRLHALKTRKGVTGR